jgi:hypothetical protein
LAYYNLQQNKVHPADVVIYRKWAAMSNPYMIQGRKDNLIGGVDVHEHPFVPVFSDGSHPVGVHADPAHT